MPTIGKATIDVDYDGDGLERQARRLGEEAGDAGGEGYAKGFDEKAQKGFEKTGSRLEQKARKQGAKSGEISGDAYAKNFASRLRKAGDKDLDAFGERIGKLFRDDGGLDEYTRKLTGLDSQFDRVTRTFTEVDEGLKVLRERSKLSRDEWVEHRKALDDWADRAQIDAGIADAAARKLDNYVKRLSDIGDGSHDLDQFAAASRRTSTETDRLGGAFERLGGKIRTATSGSRSITALREGFEGIIKPADGVVHSFDSLGGSVDRAGNKVRSSRGKFTGLFNILELPGKGIEALGSKILGLGDNIDSAGGKAKSAGPKFSSLFRAFSQFDPSDNLGQLILLLIAFLPQIAVLASAAAGGLVILAGAVTALGGALVVGIVGFSDIFGKLDKLPASVRPAAAAIQGLKNDFGALRDSVQEHLFAGLAGDLKNLEQSAIPAVTTAMDSLADALNNVLKKWLTDLNSSDFAQTLDNIFTGLKPSIENLGETVSNLFGIIGEVLQATTGDVADFTGGLADATGDLLAFLKTPEGHKELRGWIDDSKQVLGKLGEAIGEVAGALGDLVSNPKNVADTVESIKNIGDAAKSLTGVGDDLGSLAVGVVDAIAAISDAADKIGDIIDPIITGVEIAFSTIATFINSVGTLIHDTVFGLLSPIHNVFEGIGTLSEAFSKLTKGDFAGAAQAIQDGNKRIQDSLARVGQDMAIATGNTATYYDQLDKKTQTAASGIATNFGLSGDAAKNFAGQVARLAQQGGVDLAKLKDDKSLSEVARHLGITEDAAKYLLGSLADTSTGGKDALNKLKASASSNLDGVVGNMGATGKAAGVLKDAFLKTAGDSDKALSGLAGAKSWGDVESKLAGAGSAAKTKMADNIIAAAQASGVKIDQLPPKIQALVEKYGTIPKSKHTDVTVDTHGASSFIDDLSAKLRGIPNIERTVTIINRQQHIPNAVGGIMAGGMQLAGGGKRIKMATGGILNQPTYFGNVLAGEAGPEAIVPLTGALSSVDRSVRGLAAYARGIVGGVSDPRQNAVAAGPQIAKGAIVVNEAGNGQTTATAVLDRIAARLG